MLRLRGGAGESDPIHDWERYSSLPGRSRSADLKVVDAAVRDMVGSPESPRLLRRVLQEIARWKASKTPRSARWRAVDELEKAVQSELSRHEARTAEPVATMQPPLPPVEGFAGAIGFEAELHGYAVSLPRGDVAADYDAVVENSHLKIVLDTGVDTILEVVSKPARLLAGGQDDGRAEGAHVVAAFDHVLTSLGNVSDRGALLERVFTRRDGYRVDPMAAGLRITAKGDRERLFMHYTVGIPVNGLIPFLHHAARHARRETGISAAAHQHLAQALAFGDRMAAEYTDWLAGRQQLGQLSRAEDVPSLAGFLALTYTQFAAVAQKAISGDNLSKNYSVVTSRVSLGGVRKGLSLPAQEYLEESASQLARNFARNFTSQFVNRRAILDLLAEALPPRWRGDTGRRGTIGDYLENALTGGRAWHLSQSEAMGVRTDFTDLDDNQHNGVGLIDPPLVVLELRHYGPRNATTQDFYNGYRALQTQALGLFNAARQPRGLRPVGIPLATGGPFARPSSHLNPAPGAGPVAEPDEAAAPGLEPDWYAPLSKTGRVIAVPDSRIEVPEQVGSPIAARMQLVRLLSAMLADADAAARVRESDVRVVVVPRDVPLTEVALPADVTQHAHAWLTTTPDGREVRLLRGATYPLQKLVLVAEENLLGERTGVDPDQPFHADGYSSVVHELAHMVYHFGLTDRDQQLVQGAFTTKTAAGATVWWADGPLTSANGVIRGNYSSQNPEEYFAQTTNAYLGVNQGNDPLTGQRRNNGTAEVRANEPVLLPLLERLYGTEPVPLPWVNPLARTTAENNLWQGFREFLALTTASESAPAPTAETTSGRPNVPQGGQTASERDLRAIRYLEASEEFERRLAAYILNDVPAVAEQVSALTRAAWSLVASRDPARLARFGTPDVTAPGSVGYDRRVLEGTMREGNMREHVAMLNFAMFGGAFKNLFGIPRHPVIEEQRTERQKSPKAPTWERPENVRPPLSEAERAFAVRTGDDGTEHLLWARGEQYTQLRFSGRLHQQSEAVGGLVSTGVSGSTFAFLQLAKELAVATDIAVDMRLVRLAAIGAFVGVGHHTMHEVMLGAQLWDEAEGGIHELDYDNDLRRFRRIPPLTEDELRLHVAPGGIFPDEHVLPDLDHMYGSLAGPKNIKDGDKDDQGELRPNPLWYRLEDFWPALLERTDAHWLYTVDRHGDVLIGSEKLLSVVREEELDRLYVHMRERDPALTREALRDRLDKQGHPTVAAGFDLTGRTFARAARVSGELRFNIETEQWEVNDKSGRYMSVGVRPDVTAEEAQRWLGNVARRMTGQLGLPIVPVVTKRASTTSGVAQPAQQQASDPVSSGVQQTHAATTSSAQPALAEAVIGEQRATASADGRGNAGRLNTRTPTPTTAEGTPAPRYPTMAAAERGFERAREVLGGLPARRRQSLLRDAARIMAERHQSPSPMSRCLRRSRPTTSGIST